MGDYYLKLKQNQSEIEFSTSDRVEFNQKIQELMQLAGALEKNVLAKNMVETETKVEKEPAVETEKSDFEKILEKSLEHPIEQVSPNFSPDRSFEFIFKNCNLDTTTKQIVFTAGYIEQFENKEMFTLKEINRKLFPITNSPIGHADINQARVDGMIAIMPNYADKQALTQYVLTEKGEKLYGEMDV